MKSDASATGHATQHAGIVLSLAIRLLRREWRSGELRVLVLALLVAIAATTSISFFTDRLGQALLNQSAEMIGGDLVVRGTRPLKPQWLQTDTGQTVKITELIEFSTVSVHQQNILLASVKAVSANYPLYGKVHVAEQAYGDEITVRRAPTPGTVWVDRRVLNRLEAKVGDSIGIGAALFRIDRVLLLEPDRGGNYFNLAPRILMHQQDLNEAAVLQPGSRANYKYLYAGEASVIQSLKKRLQPQMGPGYRLMSAGEGREGAGLVLQRTKQYLGLTALLAIILAALAIAVATRRYSQRHYDVSAMLRCLGATQATIFQIYLLQMLMLALLCGVLGTLLGWGVQEGLVVMLQNVLQLTLPTTGWQPVFIGFASGVVILFGTALPPVWRLKRVSPLRVMRRELMPLPLKGWFVYGSGWLALCLIVLLFSNDLILVFTLLAGVGLVVLLLAMFTWLLINITKRTGLTGLGLPGRGIARVVHRSRSNTLQITAFALTLMLMVMIAMLRSELLANWSVQLPKDVPNHFAFNILPSDTNRLDSFFGEHNLASPVLYPMVRGRLVQINGEDIKALLFPDKDEAPRNGAGDGVNRELNLSWADTMPVDNQIVAGQWWARGPPEALGTGQQLSRKVSVEEDLAKRLGIKLHDELRFDIAGQELTVVVTSLRSVVWESFKPNFYMLFSPGALDGYPATYITSFRLSAQDRDTLMQLVRQFPSVTVLEVDALIEQLQSILEQVTVLVELMLVFVLLAGLCVLLATIQSTLDERLREGALMRALGASKVYLQTINRLEFAFMGLIAGLLAMAGAELMTAFVYQRVFSLQPHLHGLFWLWVPLASALLIGLVGSQATASTVRRSPMSLLRHYDQ